MKKPQLPNTETDTTHIFPKPSGLRGKLDHHPSSINQLTSVSQKQKDTFKICTYNVRSLSTTERYLELTYALEYIKCDVIGLCEIRRLGCKIEEDENYIFCYIGQTKGLHGVGFLIKKYMKNTIVNFIGISERVALLQLEINKVKISIIQAYAPVDRSSDSEIQRFYKDLRTAHELSDDKVLVLGDFNAKIGQPRKEENLIMGSYGYGSRNERGEQLISYAYENKLSFINTFFKKRLSRRWTWMSPDHKTRNEIDFIMTNCPKLVSNYEVISNIKFATDHRLLRATLVLNRQKKSRKNFRSLPTGPVSKEDINCFLFALQHRITKIPIGATNIQSCYDMLEEAITFSLSSKNKLVKKKQHRVFSDKTVALIKRRSELVNIKNKDNVIKKKISNIYKEVSKSIKTDYKQYRKNVITKNLKKYRSTKKAFKKLNLSKDWIQKLQYDSKETKSRIDIIELATKFYQDLYRRRDKEDKRNEHTNNANNIQTIKKIEEQEVYSQIKQLKTDRSPGSDGITNEAIKLGAPILTSHFTRFFNMVLDIGIVPKQWCTSDIILLYKKGNPLDIKNYRPISLMSNIYKLFASIILARIRDNIDSKQPIEQAGFRSGFSTTDHIQTLDQVIEKYREYDQPLYLTFIDYSKAFDTISHQFIWNALNMCEVHPKYLNIIKSIYNNCTST